MGNPNARPKKSSTASSKSIVSPKTLSHKLEEQVVKGDAGKQAAAGARAGRVEKVAAVNKKDDLKPKHLRFKSHQTGTLVTNHFEPYPEGLPPASPSSFQKLTNLTNRPPSADAKNLLTTSLPFVPGNPLGGKTESGNSADPMPMPSTLSSTVENGYHPIQGFPERRTTYVHQSNTGSKTSVRNTLMIPSTRNKIAKQPPRATRTFLDRADRGKKNVLITESSIKHNVVLITEHRHPNGQFSHYSHGREFDPQTYNFIDALKAMRTSAKQIFWGVNYVDITLDLRDIIAATDDKPDVKGKGMEIVWSQHKIFEQIESLGPEFPEYVKILYLNILFPAPAPDAVIPKFANTNGPSTGGRCVYPDSRKVIGTPAFAFLEEVAAKIDTFPNIQRLEVILQNPRATSTSPFTLEMLYHTLPFYDLSFQGWNIRWQAAFMSHAEPVGHFPIILLDKERNYILWKREQKALEAKRNTRNAVYVRHSIALQYNQTGI